MSGFFNLQFYLTKDGFYAFLNQDTSTTFREGAASMNVGCFRIFDLIFKFGDWFLALVGHHYAVFRWFVRWTPAPLIRYSSRLRAWRAYKHASLFVPAYREFLKARDYLPCVKQYEQIPETDKDNYIKKFSTDARCVKGVIPSTNIVIDESSGSSGTPYNWVRSLEERRVSHLLVSHFARFCFGTPSRLITINAFSMGSWATGLNMGLALQKNGLVKNVGPDIEKILHTLQFFGPSYSYLICGYPPFLKYLIDEAGARKFPLSEYELLGLVGGEGMSEGLRDYLLARFKKVYSGYGATDLEIGIAGESPISVAIRREARNNTALRHALFGEDSRLPMLFHYNPMMHHIEVNANKELIFTITRLNVLSPRVRYNIHDEGGVMDFGTMVSKCRDQGLDLAEKFGSEYAAMPRLPFMWIYGRKDSTISVMGANIYPEDIEQCLYAEPALAKITRSFCIGLHEEQNQEVRPSFSFEIVGSDITEKLKEEFQQKILRHLIALNKDFKEAWHEHKATLIPTINLWPEHEGPFKQDSSRIKQIRVIK
ncbi:MAG: phenylacetate--CoA ligase family protein [Parcubacteria group bacterium]|nr:phenylacetate--CoA ligase family protein [Parcubacteria group bacterium]